jgi:ribosomal protein S18 acetylase RimI-like enzyme
VSGRAAVPEPAAVRTSPLRPGEDGAAARVAVAAFAADPYWDAIGPDHRGLRRRVIAAATGADLRRAREAGEWVRVVRDDEDPVGIARVAEGETPPLDRLPPAWTVCCGLGGGARWRRAERALRAVRPRCCHLYLYTLAVLPDRQRAGIGAGLLREAIDLSRDSGLPFLLDTMKEENVAYYERFGFVTVASVPLPRGQRAWVMEWRGDQGEGRG